MVLNSMTGIAEADTEAPAPFTTAISEFVSGLRFEQIPAEVIERIRLLILDSLGCGIFGSGLPWSKILQDTLSRVDATPAVEVWGTPLRLSAPSASGPRSRPTACQAPPSTRPQA